MTENLGKYHDLYLRINTSNFFKFLKISLEIYELDPACFLSAPGLAWQATFKKTEVK